MSEPSTRPPKVSKRVAGSRRLKRTYVEKKLGPNAFAVWLALLWRRGRDGCSFAKLETLAAATALPANLAHRALVKLRRVGLVEPLGWISKGKTRRQARRVKGDYRDGEVAVTKAIERKLGGLGRGGRRAGAGRPSTVVANLTPEVATDRRACRFENEIKPSRSKIKPSRSRGQSVTLSVDFTPKKSNEGAGVDGSCYHLRDLKRGSEIPSVGSSEPTEGISPRRGRGHSFDLSWSAFERLGIPLDCEEPAVLRRLLAPGGPFVPPFVTTDMMATPRLPPPPLLPAGLDDYQAALRLVRYFRGAVENLTGEPCFILSRCDLRHSRYYRTLVSAAQAFREHEVAPAAWAAFSCDVWAHYSGGQRRRVPPINWVFSEGRIDERLGWFRREEAGYGGGRLLFPEEHRDLLCRANAMRRCFLPALRKEERDGHRVNAALFASVGCDLLEEWFPGAPFQSWLDRARRAGERDCKRIREIVDRGEFVWS